MTQQKMYRNLSFFQSVLVSIMIMFEGAYDVLHVHRLIFQHWLSAMTLCDQKPLKPHNLNAGDAGTSKSFMLEEILPNLLITDT